MFPHGKFSNPLLKIFILLFVAFNLILANEVVRQELQQGGRRKGKEVKPIGGGPFSDSLFKGILSAEDRVGAISTETSLQSLPKGFAFDQTRDLTGYLADRFVVPESRAAISALCSQISELFSLISNEEFKDFIKALQSRASLNRKHLAFVKFLLDRKLVPIHPRFESELDKVDELLVVMTREEGKSLEAKSVRDLVSKLVDKVAHSFKMVHLGKTPSKLTTFTEGKASGVYLLAYMPFDFESGHALVLQILPSGKIRLFDPNKGDLSLKDFARLYNGIPAHMELFQRAESARNDLILSVAPRASDLANSVYFNDIPAIKAMLDVNPSAKNPSADDPISLGFSPLTIAAGKLQGGRKLMRALMETHPEVQLQLDMRDRMGRTAAFMAAQWGHLKNLEFLAAQGADLTIVNIEGLTPLMVAITNRHDSVVRFLCSHYKEIGQTKALDIADLEGATALHYAVGLAEAGKRDMLQMVRALLIAGASPNARDIKYGGVTPLVIAISMRNEDMALLLLEHGADPRISSNGSDCIKLAEEYKLGRVLQAIRHGSRRASPTPVKEAIALSAAGEPQRDTGVSYI